MHTVMTCTTEVCGMLYVRVWGVGASIWNGAGDRGSLAPLGIWADEASPSELLEALAIALFNLVPFARTDRDPAGEPAGSPPLGASPSLELVSDKTYGERWRAGRDGGTGERSEVL